MRAASAALERWRVARPGIRRDALNRLGDLLGRQRDELVVAARENGTPVSLGLHQVALARQWVKY